MTDYAGRTLGPYRLEVLLGKGGMATVYRAYQVSVKRYVAIKVMSPEIANQPGFVERFDREAEVIASLEHPHILPVMDYGNENDTHYLVMRYIEGGSLEDRMRRAPLTLDEAARFLTQMASALTYAHKRGVIHRDIKPNNVLLDAGENAYLTDFGIARLAQSQSKLTATGSVMGTPAYMSPEQGMGNPVDARSDIYTLGVVLYEMVLNRLPFSADTPAAMIFQHVYEQPKNPQQIRPDLPSAVISVLNKAMAKSPDERYQSANELATAFSNAISARTELRRSVDPADMEGTLVGGPIKPVPVSGSTPARTSPRSSTRPSPDQSGEAAPARRPPVALIAGGIVVVIAIIAVAAVALISGSGNAQTSLQQTGTAVALLAQTIAPTTAAPATQTGSTQAPVASPTTLVVDTGTPNTTLTAIAAQMSTVNAFQTNQTATTVAQATQISGSATTTRLTEVSASTNTVLTAIAAQMSTVNAFQTNQTATTVAQAAANASATSAAITAQAQNTVNAAMTTTARSLPTATPTKGATSDQNQTLAALTNLMKTNAALSASTDVSAATATAAALPTSTPTLAPTATSNSTLSALGDLMKTNVAAAAVTESNQQTQAAQANPTATLAALASDRYMGKPEDAIKLLANDGKLPSPVGSLLVSVPQQGVEVSLANQDQWQTLQSGNITNFVLSAEVTWSANDTNNECGLIYRYSVPSAGSQDYTFYTFSVSRAGSYAAWVRDASGYRNSPMVNLQSRVVQSGNRATNHLMVIAQGSHFMLYLNGQLAGSFNDNTYQSGSVALLGTRLQNSTGLTCAFQNIWVYSLQ